MTIYTDPETGKKYDRIPGGATGPNNENLQTYIGCDECAFSGQVGCAARPCTYPTATKSVFFVFKERKA